MVAGVGNAVQVKSRILQERNDTSTWWVVPGILRKGSLKWCFRLKSKCEGQLRNGWSGGTPVYSAWIPALPSRFTLQLVGLGELSRKSHGPDINGKWGHHWAMMMTKVGLSSMGFGRLRSQDEQTCEMVALSEPPLPISVGVSPEPKGHCHSLGVRPKSPPTHRLTGSDCTAWIRTKELTENSGILSYFLPGQGGPPTSSLSFHASNHFQP